MEVARQVVAQAAAYGFGGDPAFQPAGCVRGETAYVALGEQQAGIVPAEVCEEVEGGLRGLGRLGGSSGGRGRGRAWRGGGHGAGGALRLPGEGWGQRRSGRGGRSRSRSRGRGCTGFRGRG
ncbi:hypothetical protein A6A06_32530 [Streptomyces sp. CB02923]|nr:hypothetical protein A6A06_32530 [Streptomyces sp. CB02923]